VVLVYKVLSRSEWSEAERDGVFRGSEVDRRDGFIHLSTANQLEKTVSLWFTDRDDLMLVAIRDGRIADALKWEPSRGGVLFPHCYGSLPLECVAWAKPFSSRDGDVVRALIDGADRAL
jgi:uncharacterized protein (DUF952 family)